ncbi:outer membrane beta-barrel protein [Ulvibacter antarcticus]|uniref:Outer membrane protein beta-barrel domain-containing protein n=1 Tax=Ulvibacter antarcticus TaxID=442714 RepID=A0A3L9YZC8_9FLAO|nr:outer membrane beta-barrel protein [Ulvibacter antarcticus]RMA65933.1 hypothetical protein BXY75_0349 [Ulvibacter antarcticus]
MKENKHIDSLFKDRLNDFEASPSPQVWKNIQAELNKDKEDRKVIPLWWKLGGVAALLALLLTVGNSMFNSDVTDSDVVNTEESVRSNDIDTEANPIITNKEDVIVVASEEDATNNKLQEIETTSEASEQIKKDSPANYKESVSNKSENNSRVASETNSSEEKTKKAKATYNSNRIEAPKNPVYSTEKEAVAINSEEKTKNIEKLQKENDVVKSNQENLIIKNTQIEDTEVAKTETAEDEKSSEEKKSILDEIKEQEILKKEDAIAKESKIDRRWDVAPNFAPVYYNSLDGGSSIDQSFSDNSQSGDVNISYGVQVSYAISNRLSVRSGVNNVDLSYGTKGIELGTGPVSTALRSVNYGGKEIVLTAVDQGGIAEQNSMNSGEFGDISPKSTDGEAIITQNISYYEVPLELKYSLFNNKFGMNVIGGLSTLFLGNNDISVKAGSFESTLGEANNLSTVSFTTNVGLGFDYKISRKFKFNIEPMFKYQLNPYTDSSVNFKPYYLGVYTGFSYKF